MLSTDYKYYRAPYGTVGRPDSQTCPVRPQGIPGVDTLRARGVRGKGSSRRDTFGNSDRPRGYSFPSRGTRTTSQRLRTAVVPLRTTPPALPAGGYSSHSLRTTFLSTRWDRSSSFWEKGSSHPSRAMPCEGETFFPTHERSGGDLYSKSWSPLEYGQMSRNHGAVNCQGLRSLWDRFGAAGFAGGWRLEVGAEEEPESPGATCDLREWQLSFPRLPAPVERRDGNCGAALGHCPSG